MALRLQVPTGSISRTCLPAIQESWLVAEPTRLFVKGVAAITSLPLLPVYPVNRPVTIRWGEDTYINSQFPDRPIRSGLCKYRNNFDNCHPVSTKEHGKMSRPCIDPVKQDFRTLPSSGPPPRRRVPRKKPLEVFPTHDTGRTSPSEGEQVEFIMCFYGGFSVLLEDTKTALDDYRKKAYGGSSYRESFADTSDDIKCLAERDEQYFWSNTRTEHPTCSVLGHPDPCPMCWNGGAHLAGEWLKTSRRPRPPMLPVRKRLEPSEMKSKSFWEMSGNGRRLVKGKENSSTSVEASFGPWSEIHNEQSTEKEDALPSNTSKLHDECVDIKEEQQIEERESCPTNSNVENSTAEEGPCSCDVVEDCRCTNNNEQDEPDVTGSGSGSRHVNQSLEAEMKDDAVLVENEYNAFKERLRRGNRNRWSYRDENNLRIPCMSQVYDTLNKSDFHTRFHQKYPDLVPDLRDWVKYHKRVSFSGYNSSVFR